MIEATNDWQFHQMEESRRALIVQESGVKPSNRKETTLSVGIVLNA